MDEHGWISAHLFYHADADLLLTRLVGPLTADLAADRLADRFFFLRYWDGGPHLRLRLAPRPGCGDEVRARLRARAAGFFERHPSPAPLDSRGYAAQAAVLAAAEGVPDYLPHPRPADSLEFIPYRREHHRYGHGSSMDAVEEHFVEASRIALELVATGMPAGFRTTAAYSTLLVAWLASGTAPAQARWGGPPRGPALARAEAAYDRQREKLRAIARAAHAQVRHATRAEVHHATHEVRGGGGPRAGALAGWARSLTRLRAALELLTGPPAPAVIDLCAHLMCNRLGVSVHEESHLRHLAARALGEVTGTDADAG
jgi:thiopeptide-type bacteriocin biosynthesis protein